MATTLRLLCAGAAQGVVQALQARRNLQIDGRFGAVGMLEQALLDGAPCDVMVVTDAMVGKLVAGGRLRGETRAALGRVRTGIAVKSGQARPDVSTPQALKAALLGADAVFFPDAERSTAGIHFAGVMRDLGVFDVLRPRLRTFPNGATAMRELAACDAARPIGCTQLSEILYTPGVQVVAALPARFELATVYSAAAAVDAADAAAAQAFIALLAGPASAALRARMVQGSRLEVKWQGRWLTRWFEPRE